MLFSDLMHFIDSKYMYHGRDNFIYIFNHLSFKLVLKPCFLFLMRLYMSQIYLELPISYYPWKVVLNNNLIFFLSGIPIPRAVNR